MSRKDKATTVCEPIPGSPRVSIIIPVYNQCQFIGQAVDSVLGQSCDALEIIVIDDGSTDATATMLETYRQHLCYIHQENAGPSSARNLGLEHARGEFVIFLDGDDWMLPGKIAGQLACFEAEPALDLVSSGVRIFDHEAGEIEVIEPWLRWPRLDLESCLLSHAFYLPAIMFRRAVMEKAGGFNPQLRQAEDVELLLRMLQAGAKAGWYRTSTVMHRLHPGSLIRATGERVASVNGVFASFFARRDLPSVIAGMENEVCYQVLMWSVWQLYRQGDQSLIPVYLRQTLAYLNGSPSSILHRWMENVLNHGRAETAENQARALADFLPFFRAAFEMERSSPRDAREA